MSIRETFNFSRFDPRSNRGHYESFFQRGNHPKEPLAFWIRYTVFSPRNHPENAIGELWAVFFDGASGRHTALKSEHPISRCEFARDRFSVRVEHAVLHDNILRGGIGGKEHSIRWDLSFDRSAPPLFDFPENLYSGGFPKAKVLVGHPLSRFDGSILINDRKINIDRWPGTQNHNWGSKHTDHYAWGQVSGFDGAEDTFLEIATARLKIGPVWTPAFTPVVLRHEGREYRLNRLTKTLGRAQFGYYHWDFHAEDREIQIQGRITAREEDFVCLKYYNPPGGFKYCLNSKIARCELEIRERGKPAVRLTSANRAAFEILTDSKDHGLPFAC